MMSCPPITHQEVTQHAPGFEIQTLSELKRCIPEGPDLPTRAELLAFQNRDPSDRPSASSSGTMQIRSATEVTTRPEISPADRVCRSLCARAWSDALNLLMREPGRTSMPGASA